MTTVIYNDLAKALEINPTTYVAVQMNRGMNFITAMGDDPTVVREEGRFHWSVVMDYEGSYEVIETSEINIKKN